MRVLSGVEVTGYDVQGGRVRAVLTSRGRIACDLVVWGLGTWTPKHWAMLGRPSSVDCRYPDGTTVTIEFKPITAIMGSSFYIEEPDQTRGLRIDLAAALPSGKSIMATSLPVGKGVKVTGTLAGSGNERHLSQATILNAVDDNAPLPLLLRSTALGGAAPDQYTSGIAGASGPYSIGLLVRVLGKVVSHTTGSFVIDDGSFLKDSSGTRIKVTTRVYSTVAVSDGALVRATGVCGVESGVCVLRTRTPDDVMIY